MTDRAQRMIAVTGATGFIGRHLVERLLLTRHRVRALVRRPDDFQVTGADVRRMDVLDESTLPSALDSVDTAYYLVHSLKQKSHEFAKLDRLAANNFLHAAEKSGVRRIVYLGGLGELGPNLSEHLRSRAEVGEILQSGRPATTVLRAGIILGPESASWQMLRQLVERLPVMTTPRWVETRSQPIALRDVLGYLVGCAEVEETDGGTFDIGGPDVLTYRQMMEKLAKVMSKRLYIFGIPVLTPRLSSYWVDLVTDVPSSLAHPLIEGLRNEVICRDHRIQELVPMRLTPYEEAVRLALRGEV